MVKIVYKPCVLLLAIILVLNFKKNFNSIKVVKLNIISIENNTRNCVLASSGKQFGNFVATEINTTILNYDEIVNEFLRSNYSIKPGGQWSPEQCKSLHRVAIVVPYRDRANHLKIFLRHIHPFLIKQKLDYGIYLIEPEDKITFNRGLLMNIGFSKALELSNNYWNCFVFHDVDLIPENNQIDYSCPKIPTHLSSAVSSLNYKPTSNKNMFGGVTSLSKQDFINVNGYSNLFFGWGGEDNDHFDRIIYKKLNVYRYPLAIGRYTSLNHAPDTRNPHRWEAWNSGYKRYNTDGLNSLDFVTKKIEIDLLYTKIKVSYNKKEIAKKHNFTSYNRDLKNRN